VRFSDRSPSSGWVLDGPAGGLFFHNPDGIVAPPRVLADPGRPASLSIRAAEQRAWDFISASENLPKEQKICSYPIG
jgi:hypothetical protein